MSIYPLWLAKVICKLDYKVVGQEHVPQGPCIFACKHQSSWDTAIFLVLYSKAVYVLKKELTNIPIYGQFLKKYGMIVIDRNRGRQALRDLLVQTNEALEQGKKVVIFPEGSRVAVGQKAKIQKGIYALYKSSQYPIVPVTLDSGKYWEKRSWFKYPGTITLKYFSPMPQGLEADEFMDKLSSCIDEAV